MEFNLNHLTCLTKLLLFVFQLLESSYRNQLQDVNEAANQKINPLRKKTTLTEQNLKEILLRDRKRLAAKKSRRSGTDKARRAVGASAKRKGFCMPVGGKKALCMRFKFT